MYYQKSPHESCRMGRRIVVIKLICLLGHCEREGHTIHKLSQRCLTADWLAPRKNDCPRMNSKASSDWLPGYIKASWTVLEIFKMIRYFPDSCLIFIQGSPVDIRTAAHRNLDRLQHTRPAACYRPAVFFYKYKSFCASITPQKTESAF